MTLGPGKCQMHNISLSASTRSVSKTGYFLKLIIIYYCRQRPVCRYLEQSFSGGSSINICWQTNHCLTCLWQIKPSSPNDLINFDIEAASSKFLFCTYLQKDGLPQFSGNNRNSEIWIFSASTFVYRLVFLKYRLNTDSNLKKLQTKYGLHTDKIQT